MRTFFIILIIISFGSISLNAQSRISFGVTSGVFYGEANINLSKTNLSAILTLLEEDQDALDILEGGGFFVGFLADIRLLRSFHIQPEVLYANAGGESVLILPIVGKYYIADAFNIQFGPQFDYAFDVPKDVEDFIDALGISLSVGAGFDFNKTFSIQSKYSFGLNNRLNSIVTDAIPALSPSLKTNMLQLGVVYKF